ncbi:MAG: RnfABCDGE type electron transport complex subunit D [Peptostreptococcaceae bacterium]|nr:RnfABCDGE type electron transport complex subunit D [Peptostreptococcaceae bacterium]
MGLFKDLYINDSLIVASSPHRVSDVTTSKIMRDVIIGLSPALIMSTFNFGFQVLAMASVCIAACIAFEAGFQYITKRTHTTNDLSAVVTGLILAFNLPPTLPYWMAITGCFVAIVIVKQIFGGIGQNFANPAATARIVLLLSFTNSMTTWAKPSIPLFGVPAIDAVTSATPLMLFSNGQLTELPAKIDLLLGFTGGSLGETSGIAFLIGGTYLIIRKIILPAIPMAFLGTMIVFSLLIGIDPAFQIFAGGAMLGAFFMATDYATTPITTKGKIVFGIGCGLITMLIRVYGSLPEGVSFAILFMNILTPHIDNFFQGRLYGRSSK